MYLKGNLNGLADYNGDVLSIAKRANYNAGESCRQSGTCYTWNMVDKVLKSYAKLAKSGKIKEYGNPNSDSNNPSIINAVSDDSIVTKGKTGAILSELYWMTWDNTLQDASLLYPVSKGSGKVNPNTGQTGTTSRKSGGTNTSGSKKANDVIINVEPEIKEEPKKDLITTLTDNWYYVVGGLFGAGVIYKIATKKGR